MGADMTMNENDKQAEPVAWEVVFRAVKQAIVLCKNVTGEHSRISTYVNAVQITHDALGTDNTHPPHPVALDVGNLEYMGNSVSFIYQKMRAYKDGMGKVWQALRDNGIHPDGQTHAADAIRRALAHPAQPVQPAVAQEPVGEVVDPTYVHFYNGKQYPFGTLLYAEPPAVAVNEQLLEALKSTGLFLHHCWCDVQMNDYSFDKLGKQMEIVDAAIAAAEADKAKGGV